MPEPVEGAGFSVACYTVDMSWAGSRRLLIVAGLLLVVIVVLSTILILTLPKEPSCSDGLMNQDETGVDCGGSCAYLCTADVPKPSVTYIRALESHGRIDVVGLVENLAPSAAVDDARYTIELFSPDGVLLESRDGVIDLPPGESVPLFIPGFASSGLTIGRAFLSFDESSMNWVTRTNARNLPRADATRVEGSLDAPRVTANFFNPSARPLKDITVIAVVHDLAGTVIAASQTVVDSVGAEGSVPITFTWNEPFTATPGKIDIQAVMPLP